MQIPDRFQGALETARAKALEVLEAAWDSGAAESESEWKCFLLFDKLLLAHGRSGGTCADLLEERLAWWWGGQWSTLWDSAFAPTALAVPKRPTALSDKQRARRVHTLAAGGEEGRALSAVAASRPAPRTQQTLDKLRTLLPEGTQVTPDTLHATAPSQELREEVEEEVCRLLSRAPRLTSPGYWAHGSST